MQAETMPHWAVKKRARELGLARTKELLWSEAELAILSRYAWMRDERIRLKLKAAGYARTVTAIHLKLKRMRFKHDGSLYSANRLGTRRLRTASLQPFSRCDRAPTHHKAHKRSWEPERR